MLDLSKSPVVPTSAPDCTEKRKAYEDYVRKCCLKAPQEVAELFINYTRWIWEYKCIGAIAMFYNDQTICHTENGGVTVGAEPIIAGSLQSICSYPDKINDFVDIIVEGNEEEGYSFGQSSKLGNINKGYSKYGPGTGKWLGIGDVPLYSICELTLRKVDGRWRCTEEWVVEGTEVKRMTLNAADREEVEKHIGILPEDNAVVKTAQAAAEAAQAAAQAAEIAVKTMERMNGNLLDAEMEE